MKTFVFKTLRIVLIAAFTVSSIPYLSVYAQEAVTDNEEMTEPTTQEENTTTATAAPAQDEILNLLVGDVQPIETKNLSRVAVTNPEIVDISDAKADKVYVVGKKAGQTQVFVWDNSGKRGVTVRVAIEDLNVLQKRLEEVIGKAGIEHVAIDQNVYEGKVVLSGELPKADKEVLEKITESYSDRIINLVKEQIIEDLVQVDVQITELSTTLIRQMGIDWTSGSGGTSGSTGSSNSASTTGGAFSPIYSETELPGKGKIFKVNSFGRTTEIQATVNALVQEGKGRVLSNPRVVVVSGKEASFLVGGETPIRTTSTNSTGTQSQENVSFKQYGINMTITPTIRSEKVDIVLNVQVSDVDNATKNPEGDVGFITRQAQTQLLLDNKQTIVLAGLIKHSEGEVVKGIPFLSKIPIVGGAFRTRSNGNPDADTELVITLTPTIIKTKKIAKEQITMPSKRIEKFKSKVESYFDKESLDGSAEAKAKTEEVKAVVPAPIQAVVQKPAEAPAATVIKAQDSGTSVTTPNVSIQTGTIDPVMNAATKPQAMVPYIRSIQMKISQAISYPYEAAQKNWEGTVKLRLRILKDGSLADCDVLESSGHDVFDKDAINTAKIVAPFSSFPADMAQDDLIVTVPIVYNQGAAKEDTQTVVASY